MSPFPDDMCGRCLGPKTGSHARFCEKCVARHEAEECSWAEDEETRPSIIDCPSCGHRHGCRYVCDERLALLDRAEGDLFANPPTRPTQTVETGGAL